jgi:hypothetical protein
MMQIFVVIYRESGTAVSLKNGKNELNNEIDETCANIYERQRFMEDKYSNNKNILSKLKHMTFDIINREGF